LCSSSQPCEIQKSRLLIFEVELLGVDVMLVRAIYENNVLKPLEKLDLKEGDVVEVDVKKSPVDQLCGIINIQNREWLDEIIESPELEPI
jgi:predicted DNA-binding antitoxin AbrB/MazE fold protein